MPLEGERRQSLSANPLLLFDLDVSLEWDARRDPAFLTGLTRQIAANQRRSHSFVPWNTVPAISDV